MGNSLEKVRRSVVYSLSVIVGEKAKASFCTLRGLKEDGAKKRLQFTVFRDTLPEVET